MSKVCSSSVLPGGGGEMPEAGKSNRKSQRKRRPGNTRELEPTVFAYLDALFGCSRHRVIAGHRDKLNDRNKTKKEQDWPSGEGNLLFF